MIIINDDSALARAFADVFIMNNINEIEIDVKRSASGYIFRCKEFNRYRTHKVIMEYVRNKDLNYYFHNYSRVTNSPRKREYKERHKKQYKTITETEIKTNIKNAILDQFTKFFKEKICINFKIEKYTVYADKVKVYYTDTLQYGEKVFIEEFGINELNK